MLLPKIPFGRLIPMNRRYMVILTAGSSLAVGTAVYVSGQNDGLGPELLEKRSLQLAGPNAVDCGRVTPRAEPKKATDCALAANKAGKPFRVRYDMQGIDSFVAVAFVRSPDGTVQGLHYDSDPGGGGGRAHEVVGVSRCPTPVQLYATPKGHLTCFPPKPQAPRDVMSPTFDPY
jgi:hypothetical protein